MLDRESASTSGAGPLSGFTGGLAKVVTAPLQVPAGVLRGSVQKNVVYGSTIGMASGVVRGASNIVIGTVQVFKAVIPPNPLELVSRKLAYINAAK